jgi:hypothetical protein
MVLLTNSILNLMDGLPTKQIQDKESKPKSKIFNQRPTDWVQNGFKTLNKSSGKACKWRSE